MASKVNKNLRIRAKKKKKKKNFTAPMMMHIISNPKTIS